MILNLTPAEVEATIVALSGFLDNEHDKGCDESPMVDAATRLIASLGTIDHFGNTAQCDLLMMATIEYACESQGCINPEDLDPTHEEDQRFLTMAVVAKKVRDLVGT